MDDPLADCAVQRDPGTATTEDAPFRDPDLPIDERVDDLVDRLDVAELAAFLHNAQKPIDRLGIDAFHAGGEAVHGVAWMGEATMFPQPIGLGSTWDTDLIERVGSVVGDEVRGIRERTAGTMGLNVWCPVTDPLRDPRWGRNEEGYSEDPLLSGQTAAAYAAGLAGDDPDYHKTAPSLKHFAGYNKEAERITTNAEIPPRLLWDYYLEFFRPAIESGDAVGVMSSYNFLNGRPMTVSPLLSDPVREWAPDGRAVMNVSDGHAPETLTREQAYFDSIPEARAAAVRAGLDSFSEGRLSNAEFVDALMCALEDDLLDEAHIEDAARHVLSVRFRLGEFDPDDRNPYADIGPEIVGREEHRALAREAAEASIVLLKNEDLLPADDVETASVIGPLADSVFMDWYSGEPPYRTTIADGIRDEIGAEDVETARGMDVITLRHEPTGQYVAGQSRSGGPLSLSADLHATPRFELTQWAENTWTFRSMTNERYVSVQDGVLTNDSRQPDGWETVNETFELVEDGDSVLLRHQKRGEFVVKEDDTLVTGTTEPSEAAPFRIEIDQDGSEAAATAASETDVAIVAVGTHPLIGGRETTDRETLSLPDSQRALVEAVAEANERTVVLLQSGNPVATEWIDTHIPAVLWTSHLGQETGTAVANVLFGERSPAGRLTQTWPRSVDQLPAIDEYDIERANRTYRYGQDDPLYAFGHGLTYSTFEYGEIRIETPTETADGTAELTDGSTVSVSVTVENVGSRDSDEVVQLYTSQQESRTSQPEMELRGFERIYLAAGESGTVSFELDHGDFAFWDVTRNQYAVEPATHDVMIGVASDDIRSIASVRVDGEPVPDRDMTTDTRAIDADDWAWSEVTLEDRTKADGSVVRMTDESWIAFDQVAVADRPSKLLASIACAEEPSDRSGSGRIEIRRGSRDGRLLGEATIPSTGDPYNYETVSIPLDWNGGEDQRLTVVSRGSEIRLDAVRLED